LKEVFLTLYVIDKDGKVSYRFSGQKPSEAEVVIIEANLGTDQPVSDQQVVVSRRFIPPQSD
jgi:hypothetical protein